MSETNLPYAEVIGDPIAQSKSPLIHRFWLDRHAIAADYRACHVEDGRLADYIARRRTDRLWRGCNVTMPHKQAIMGLLDRIDPLAAKMGAVNTVVQEDDGSLSGLNTDAPGFLEPLRAELSQPHLFRMARIIGNGGAARAIVSALVEEGFTLVLFGRDPARARGLLDDLDPDGEHHVAALESLATPTDFVFDDREGCLDLVINASPLGMDGKAALNLDFSHVPPRSVFYDIVTSPVETDFLTQANKRGFRTIDGLSMLIGQAALAFEYFFGVEPTRDRDEELRELLSR